MQSSIQNACDLLAEEVWSVPSPLGVLHPRIPTVRNARLSPKFSWGVLRIESKQSLVSQKAASS